MSYDPTAQANLELGYDTGPQMTYDGQFVDQEADLPLARDPSGNPTWDFQFSGLGQLLKGIGLDTSSGSALKSIGSLFTGKSDYGKLGQLVGMGGVAALLNRMMGQSSQQPVGYQGGIPKFTYERTQTPMAQQRPEGYRPGQGGISYFTPGRFTPAGYTPKTAEEFLVRPAAPAPAPAAPSTSTTTPASVPSGTASPANVGIDTVLPVNTPSGAGSAPYYGPDYTKYGFDQPLINYLQDQYNKSTFDAGIGWSYDPTTQTFSGGTMAGPQTATLAEMQNRAKGYTPQAIDPNRVALPSFAMSNIPDRSEAVGAATGGYMPGGIAMLAKGRYLRGNGDGVSDSIPARFAGSGQEARLADGEFVIPARVVSELGNGSSDAGARKLYAMLDRVEARAKKAKRGKPSGADRELNKLA